MGDFTTEVTEGTEGGGRRGGGGGERIRFRAKALRGQTGEGEKKKGKDEAGGLRGDWAEGMLLG
jgi:hypothetical protein